MDERIDVAELRDMISTLLSRIEKDLKFPSVATPNDGYWDTADSDRYDMSVSREELAPKLLTRSLSDDLNVMRKINQGKLSDSVYALVNLSSLLRAVGEQVYSELPKG
jgi:hypothetical protein